MCISNIWEAAKDFLAEAKELVEDRKGNRWHEVLTRVQLVGGFLAKMRGREHRNVGSVV